MDYYHIWCDLRPGAQDQEFCAHLNRYLAHLADAGLIAGHRLTRRKLGFGPEGLGDFHIEIQVRDLTQLDRVFQKVARRQGETEQLHQAVYSRVQNVRFALYRDFPDSDFAPAE